MTDRMLENKTFQLIMRNLVHLCQYSLILQTPLPQLFGVTGLPEFDLVLICCKGICPWKYHQCPDGILTHTKGSLGVNDWSRYLGYIFVLTF